MPHIKRVRINGISYNDGNNLIDDMMLNFNDESATYEAINGSGKSFIMLCIMQPILPNSYLVKKQPFKDVFKGKNATQVAHVAVEWSLDENLSYKYLLTGFCARKKYALEAITVKDDDDFDEGSSSMDYFTYMIFYNDPHQYDIKHFPFFEEVNGVKTRVGYEKLKNNLAKYKKELPLVSKISIGVFGPKEMSGINEYKRNIAQYNILETEWSILKQINNGETNISKFFENYQRADSFLLKFLMPEVIEKSYMWKTNANYQDSQKLAATLSQIKNQLKELASKKELSLEYEYMAKLINELLSSNEELKSLYEDKMTYEEKLCKVINYLISQIEEYKNFVELVTIEIKTLEDKKKAIKSKQDGLNIKEKENKVDVEKKKLENINEELTSKNDERDDLIENIKFLNAGNEYITYNNELISFEAKRIEIENKRKDYPELVESNDFYGNIYSEYLHKQLLDDKDKCEELKDESDENSSKQLDYQNKEKTLIDQRGRLSGEIESLENSIKENNKILDEIRPNLYFAQCFDFHNDLEQSCIKHKALEEKINIITDEINKIPSQITGYEGNKKTAENSIEFFKKDLAKKTADLDKYFDEKRVYSEIEQSFVVPAGVKLSDVITHTMDETKSDIDNEKREIQAIKNALENLNQQNPLSVHPELRKAFNLISSVYSSAELGFDNVEEVSEKEKLLSNNILIPYSIILSDSDFKAFNRNDSMKTSFGDIAIPILNREAVRGYIKLDIDFLQFSTKPLALFIDKDLIKREIEKKTKELNSHVTLLMQMQENHNLLKKRYEVAFKFENSYIATFEEQTKEEIKELNNKINKENENIKGFLKAISDLSSLLTTKKEMKIHFKNELVELTALIEKIKKYIATDDKLKIEEAKCEEAKESKDKLDLQIQNLAENIKKISVALNMIRDEIDNLNKRIGSVEEDYNTVISNITLKHLTIDQYRSVALDVAKAEYLAANESLKNKNADLENLSKLMEKHLENSNNAKINIEERYGYNIESFIGKEVSLTNNVTFKTLDNERFNIEESIRAITEKSIELKTTINIEEGIISGFKAKYRGDYTSEYDSNLFAHIEDLNRYRRDLFNEMNEVNSKLAETEKLLKEYNDKIRVNENYLGNATSIKSALEINYKTLEKDADLEFIDSCNVQIKAATLKIYKIKESFNVKVTEAKEKFAKANISNFMQELNDLNAPSSLKETELQLNVMSGEDGYINQIERERDEIDAKIKELLKIKDNFIETCAQRCDEVFNDLKKLQELSKIEVHGEKKEIIRLITKNVPEEEQRRNSLSAYISKLIQEVEEKDRSYSKEQYLKENLTLSNLFKIYFNNLERWDVSIYKVEELKAHSRYLPWSQIHGSSGQINIIYLNIVTCLISYIRKLYSTSSDNTKKVIFCDNPFGSSGAAYLYKPLMDLLERNKVQFICPGFNISASLLGLFKVNYQLGQELSPDGKVVLMVESVRGEKRDNNDDYYFSGSQLSLLDN